MASVVIVDDAELFREALRAAFVQEGLSGPSVGLGIESGSLGIDLARAFLTGSDLQADNPTFFSFRVTF